MLRAGASSTRAALWRLATTSRVSGPALAGARSVAAHSAGASARARVGTMPAAAAVAAMAHAHVVHVGDRRAAAEYITERILPDDVVLTLGAGDGNMVGQWVAKTIAERG